MASNMNTKRSAISTLFIGSLQTSAMDFDSERVTMPPDFSSFPKQETNSSGASDTATAVLNTETVYIVLQHSKASGESALLPFSNIVGVFQDRQAALKHLHALKKKHKPLVKSQNVQQPARPQFWNTSAGDDETECGFQYTSEYGEEYVVWIEEHQVRK